MIGWRKRCVFTRLPDNQYTDGLLAGDRQIPAAFRDRTLAKVKKPSQGFRTHKR